MQLNLIPVLISSLLSLACQPSNHQGLSAKSANPQIITLKIGHDLSKNSPQHFALIQLRDEFLKVTSGRYQIEIYENQRFINVRSIYYLHVLGYKIFVSFKLYTNITCT